MHRKVRGHGRMRGAMAPSLTFFPSFLCQEETIYVLDHQRNPFKSQWCLSIIMLLFLLSCGMKRHHRDLTNYQKIDTISINYFLKMESLVKTKPKSGEYVLENDTIYIISKY